MARVKICGRSLADMQMAVQRGADAIGVLVGQLHSSSDFLTPKLAAEILANTPPPRSLHIEDPDAGQKLDFQLGICSRCSSHSAGMLSRPAYITTMPPTMA
jgi:hypothetical protein